jgi:hypothetical protein
MVLPKNGFVHFHVHMANLVQFELNVPAMQWIQLDVMFIKMGHKCNSSL